MKIKKTILFLLSCVLIIGCLSPLQVNAKVNKNDSTNLNFKNASSDTIIGYMDGVAIRKKDVDEKTGEILLDTTSKNTVLVDIKNADEIPNINYTIQPRLIDGSQYWYQEATVKMVLVDNYRYNQTTYDLYLTVANARSMANKFDVSSTETIATFIAGLIPGMQVPSAVILVGQLKRSQVASDIRSYTDFDKQVRVRFIESSYGKFYKVIYWDGRTLDYTMSSSEKVAYTQLRLPVH